MKKISILLFSLTLHFSCFAQSFPTKNAIWNESIEGKFSIYGLLGDTIIDEMQYSKLYQFSDTILTVENIVTANTNHGGYLGGFRNEGQKVWYKPPGDCGSYVGGIWISEICPDILLYDFDSQEGDTVWHKAILYGYDGSFVYEDSYYSVIYTIEEYDNRKIYNVQGPVFNNLWIEGVGSEMGVLRSITTSPLYIPASDYRLNCFKHNDTVKYLNNSSCNKCFCTTTNIRENAHSTLINLYPNPAKDVLTIEIKGNIEVKSISIYSMDGKLVEKNKFSFRLGELNINKLKTGSYIVTIETNKGNLNKLIMKN